MEQDRPMRTVTVTGTRTTAHHRPAHYHALFAAYLGPFATARTQVYIGGAPGIDALTLMWLASESRASLTVVVPCTLADQPEDAQLAVHTVQRVGRLAELVELAAEALTTDAYHVRNRWMVDRSALVIGFPHGDNPASGTWYTLNYAADQGKPRLIVPT